MTTLLADWPSDLLTTGEVCAVLEISRMSITRAVKSGRITPVRRIGAGNRAPYVFAVDEVRRYAQSRRRS